jgi:hypothetical protein
MFIILERVIAFSVGCWAQDFVDTCFMVRPSVPTRDRGLYSIVDALKLNDQSHTPSNTGQRKYAIKCMHVHARTCTRALALVLSVVVALCKASISSARSAAHAAPAANCSNDIPCTCLYWFILQ